MKTLSIGLLAALLFAPLAHAQAPSTLSHQGFLEENGAPLTGTRTLSFGLYATPAGGPALWIETRPGVAITDGIFSVTLGAVTPLPSDEFDKPLWLEVAVGNTILAPRTALGATPYTMGLAAPVAAVSNDASAPGLRVESTAETGIEGIASATTGTHYGVYGVSASTGGRGVLGYASAASGPTYGAFGHARSTSGRGVYGLASAVSGTTYGVYGEAQSAGGRGVYGFAPTSSGTTYGVYGESASTGGRGVNAFASASSGNTYGVFGQAQSTSGTGVYALAAAGSGTTYGVYAQSNSPNGTGVYGWAAASSGSGIGVFGQSAATLIGGSGVEGLVTGIGNSFTPSSGVRGRATATTGYARGVYASSASPNGYGLYATNSASGGYAAYFADRVRVNDVLYVHDGSASSASIILDANFNGDGRVITDELEITGGSDLAEHFDVAAFPGFAVPLPGMVVSIDPAHAGRLALSATPYDGLVAGVVSGAGGVEPGLMMGQRGSIADGAHPIALVGRVYVLVDADYGPVRPGDLLTTSGTPGHAMVAADRERAQGAVLGKAMTVLEVGRGLVLVLVSLQ